MKLRDIYQLVPKSHVDMLITEAENRDNKYKRRLFYTSTHLFTFLHEIHDTNERSLLQREHQVRLVIKIGFRDSEQFR